MNYAIKKGIINVPSIKNKLDMTKKEQILTSHPYKIWQGTNQYWMTYLPDKNNKRRLVKRSSKESLEDVIVDFYKEQIENPTIEEVFKEWNNRKLELKKISGSTYLRNEQFYKRHYSEMGGRKIKNISIEEWEDFLERQVSEFNLTSKAFSGLKGVTKGMLKRAKKRKLINYNVEEIFNDLDVSDREFKKIIKEDYEEVFNEEETDKMIAYLKQNLDSTNTAILLMFITGVRVGEVVTLKHTDFNMNTFNIRRTETRLKDGNGNYVLEVKEFPKSQAGVRTVVIPKDFEWICNKIKTLNPFGEYIFLNQKHDRRLSASAVRRRLTNLCEDLNIYHKSPHKIRKTYGTILLDNHVDNQLIMSQMGHTDILCTETHYHRNRRTLENKTKILSSIPDFQVK